MEMESVLLQWIGQTPTVVSVIALFFYFRGEIQVMNYRLHLLEEQKRKD